MSASPADEWINSKQTPDFRLVIAWQLHDARQEQTFSEAATALLLAKPAALEQWKGKFKPQAYLYRPVVAEPDAVGMALANLLKAQQVPIDRIKHFWLSRLNRMTRHASKEAIKDSGLPVVEHDLDHAIGKPGPVNAWLLQALAAEMVQHGQGAHLIAVPDGKGVSLNLVGSAPTRVSVPYDERLASSGISIPLIVGIMALATFLIFLPDLIVNDTFIVIVFVSALVLIGISIGGDYLTRRTVERDFWGMCRRDSFY